MIEREEFENYFIEVTKGNGKEDKLRYYLKRYLNTLTRNVKYAKQVSVNIGVKR